MLDSVTGQSGPRKQNPSPVLVTVEYRVNGDRIGEFLQAIHEYGRLRRRDGAVRWGVYRVLEEADRYVETFIVSSWAEHLRQHERVTNADRAVEDRLRTYPRLLSSRIILRARAFCTNPEPNPRKSSREVSRFHSSLAPFPQESS